MGVRFMRRPHSHWTPGHLYAHRDFVLDGYGQERRTVDLEIGTRRRDCSGYLHLVAVSDPLEWDVLILGGLAGKLDFQIGLNRRGCGCRFGKLGAHDDHGKLRAACCLHHVKIAIAVP